MGFLFLFLSIYLVLLKVFNKIFVLFLLKNALFLILNDLTSDLAAALGFECCLNCFEVIVWLYRKSQVL